MPLPVRLAGRLLGPTVSIVVSRNQLGFGRVVTLSVLCLLVLVDQADAARPWLMANATVDSLLQASLPSGRFQLLADDIYPNAEPHLGRGLLELPDYYQWKRRLSTEAGLDYVLLVTPIVQSGSHGQISTANTETDFLGQWRVFEGSQSYGKFVWWLLWINNMSTLFTGDFSRQQGLTLETNFGDVPRRNFVILGDLWWEHELAGGRFMYRAGQLYTNLIWANNKYINDDRDSFFATPLSSQQGVSWGAQRGLGAQVTGKSGSAYLAIGFHDQKANQDWPDPGSFADGKFTYLAELGWTPGSGGERSGKYSVTISHSAEDESGTTGTSVMVDARQDLSPSVGLFGRYGQSFDRLTAPFEKALVVGLAFPKTFGWNNDQAGIGFMYGHPADHSLARSDRGCEVYWRLLLTSRIDVTPNIQYYWSRSRSTDDDAVTVLGFRLRLVL